MIGNHHWDFQAGGYWAALPIEVRLKGRDLEQLKLASTRVANAADIIEDTKTKFLPELIRQFPDISIGLQGQENRKKDKLNR